MAMHVPQFVVLTFSLTLLSTAQSAERVLRFPADRSVGILSQRPTDESRSDLWQVQDWSEIGEARGDVHVDADSEIQLEVSAAASDDLSFLDALNPDDLFKLHLSRSKVDDDELVHVGRLSGLRALELDQSRITDAGIAHLSGLKKLRRIGLEAFQVYREGFGVGDESLELLAQLPELESIDLRLTKITDQGLKHLAGRPTLKVLSISGTKTSDAGVAMLKQLPRLEYLRLGVYDEGIPLTDEGLRHVGEMESLQDLDLSGTQITDTGLVHLRGLKQLKNLSLDETQVTPAGLAQLEPLQSLESLRAYLASHLDDESVKAVARMKSLRRLTTHLDISDAGVEALATLPHLESMSLSGQKITDAAMVHVGRMKSLKSLELQAAPVSDAGLTELSQLKQLETLELSETRVTSRGIQHLGNLPGLKRLAIRIDEDAEAGDVTMPTLKPIGEITSLRALTLNMSRLSNKDLADLAGLVQLEELSISGLPVNDLGAFYLGGLTSLTQLTLEDAVVTDRGLAHLSNLRNLAYLELAGHFTNDGLPQFVKLNALRGARFASPYITDVGIDALAEAMTNLGTVRRFRHHDGLPQISYRDTDTFRREGAEVERTRKNALEQKAPPPWQLTGWVNTAEGGHSLDDLAGKVVLVDFWGTWCGPCRAAMPKLKALQAKYPDDLVIVGIHTTGESELMPAYIAAEGIPWPNACDDDEQTVRAWGVDSYPDLYVIDRNGILRVADLYAGDLERTIHELVAEKSDKKSTGSSSSVQSALGK